MSVNQSMHDQSLCYERGLCDSFFNAPSSLALREKQQKKKRKEQKRPARKETTVSRRAPPWLTTYRKKNIFELQEGLKSV